MAINVSIMRKDKEQQLYPNMNDIAFAGDYLIVRDAIIWHVISLAETEYISVEEINANPSPQTPAEPVPSQP